MLILRSSTQRDIAQLLSDGKPRTANEIAKELGHPWQKVSDCVGRMAKQGTIIAAAGRAYRPVQGHCAKRWTIGGAA